MAVGRRERRRKPKITVLWRWCRTAHTGSNGSDWGPSVSGLPWHHQPLIPLVSENGWGRKGDRERREKAQNAGLEAREGDFWVLPEGELEWTLGMSCLVLASVWVPRWYPPNEEILHPDTYIIPTAPSSRKKSFPPNQTPALFPNLTSLPSSHGSLP